MSNDEMSAKDVEKALDDIVMRSPEHDALREISCKGEPMTPDHYRVGCKRGTHDETCVVTKLTLNDCGFDAIPKPIGTFTSLERLYLHDNKISTIEGLDTLTHLTVLKLQRNNIKKIEGLDHLTNLITLSVAWNDIEKIEGLDKLENLGTLNLEGNKIRKIENLDTIMPRISKLYIGVNRIPEREVRAFARKHPRTMISM